MALKHWLVGIGAFLVICVNGAMAQTANQDGILLLDAVGKVFSASNNGAVGVYVFNELEALSNEFDFGLPIMKDIEFVADEAGAPMGAYAVDALGGQYALNLAGASSNLPTPFELSEKDSSTQGIPYWGFDVVEDLEVAPDWRLKKNGYSGYFILDSDGAIHSVGLNNLPKYPYPATDLDGSIVSALEQTEIVTAPFPSTIDITGSGYTAAGFLNGDVVNFPVNRAYYFTSHPGEFYEYNDLEAGSVVNTATPVYLYFGLGTDIARDLEVSAEFVQMTVPTQNGLDTRTIAMTNGYYVLDGLGGVHSSRLALDFDVTSPDGKPDGIYYGDMVKDPSKPIETLTEDDLKPEFGEPINNAILAEPWFNDRANLPYFGIDAAVDLELTPSGKGFYLLDVFGGVFAIGDARFNFPANDDGSPSNSRTPYFNIQIARDLVIVPNAANDLGIEANRFAAGYIVLDAFGNAHTAGVASNYNIKRTGNNGKPIFNPLGTFVAVETAPVWTAAAPTTLAPAGQFIPISAPSSVSTKLKVGFDGFDFSVAPGFRTVTAAFTTISPPRPN
ncbi:MAG: hypothetical protein P9L94_19965 [Candidatus Hinthialibacter antarcticus]|nr:hypothetical protein [Candidatus Hinthialibacter antarcticus]